MYRSYPAITGSEHFKHHCIVHGGIHIQIWITGTALRGSLIHCVMLIDKLMIWKGFEYDKEVRLRRILSKHLTIF
ncbi:hypothetical protein VNO77_24443 [Canavalia gladiata]|uniref:Uncharacterized protein n=1 Tax=Canavalia gladiata TaxID=3824 RepID=A0AAN9L6B0_CANGL